MKKIILLSFSLFLLSTAFAQAKHELYANAFGGLQTLHYTLVQNGSRNSDFGGGGGLGYTFNFHKNWGVTTGIDISYYAAKTEHTTLNESYTGFDALENTEFIFQYKTINYKESTSALFLQIPVAARYTLPLKGDKHNLHFTGGIQLGIPVNSRYIASAGNLQSAGSYTYENQAYQNIPGVFVNQPMEEQSGNFDANISIQLLVEAAYYMAIGEKNGLSIGLYFHYGLNNMQGLKDKHPVAFDAMGNPPLTYNSLLDSKLVSSLRPMAIGLKLRFHLGL